MIRSLEGSLKRLNTDYVDVFMPHFPDGTTPMEEILTDSMTLPARERFSMAAFPTSQHGG